MLHYLGYTLHVDYYNGLYQPTREPRFAARMYGGVDGDVPVRLDLWTWHEDIEEAKRAAMLMLADAAHVKEDTV